MEEGALEEDIYIDAQQQYTSKQEGISFKEIALRHLAKIGEICTTEFREGYWEERPIKVGDSILFSKTYKPDTRDAFIHAIKYLRLILAPRFKEEHMDKINEILKRMESEKENVKDKSVWKEKCINYSWEIFEELNFMLSDVHYLAKETIR